MGCQFGGYSETPSANLLASHARREIQISDECHFMFLSASGVLKGFDPLLNLVLDGTTEYLRGG